MNMKIAGLAIGIAVAVVAASVFVILLNNDNEDAEGEYDYHLNKYYNYNVSGYSGMTTVDGTLRIDVTAVDGSEITMRYQYSVYQTTSGNRTPLIVAAVTVTLDVAATEEHQVWQHQETLQTHWGTKAVDVWTMGIAGTSMTVYTDIQNEDLGYKMEEVYNGTKVIYNLTATNYTAILPTADPSITTQIEITVHSVRSLWTGTYTVIVNGITVKSWQLGPGDTNTFTYDFVSKMSDGHKVIDIITQSTAISGPLSETKQIVTGTGVKMTVGFNT